MTERQSPEQPDTPASGQERLSDEQIRTVWTDPWGLDPQTGAPPVIGPGGPGGGPSPQLGDDTSDDW